MSKSTKDTFPNRSEGKEEVEADLIRYAKVKSRILGVMDSMVIKCAIKIGLFDAIHNHGRSISLSDLASSLSGSPAALRRVLRYLAHIELINIDRKIITQSADGDDDGQDDDDDDDEEDEFYSLTVASTYFLREDSEKGFAPWIRFLLEEDVQSIFCGLDFCVTGGRVSGSELEVPTAIERVRGMSFFEWTSKDASINKRFNLAMRSFIWEISVAVVALPAAFVGVKKLVDVGGGTGATASTVVKAFPHIEKCIVYDLQHVIENVSPSEGDMVYSYTPQQVGVVERRHRHILEITSALFQTAQLLKSLWAHGALTSTYLINQLLSPNICNILLNQILYKTRLEYNHFQVFGCLCYPLFLL